MTSRRGTHDYASDPRNDTVQIYIDGELFPRHQARVSVFDSGFVFGDGVWEGIRVHRGVLLFFDEHMARLRASAKAIDLDLGHGDAELRAAIAHTLEANGMTTGVHVRLMVTRGVRATPYQDPRVVIGPPTVVIVAEHKQPLPETLSRGLDLFTVHVRRGAPDVQDPKINSHSKLNCVLACIQATRAGADEALMLDPHGFVSTCNSTNFFIVNGGEVWTSTGRYCLAGITRAKVLELCGRDGIVARERDFSLMDVYAADEAFVTGTFAGVVPVVTVDGRTIGSGRRGPLAGELQRRYADLIEEQCA
jgi:branched-chain amino acid aminotransferase